METAMLSRVPRTRSRFTAETIGQEVERARVTLRISVPEITDRIGMNRTYWYKKIKGKPAFDLDELGRICEEFHAPMGWPVLTWDTGLLMEKVLDRDKA